MFYCGVKWEILRRLKCCNAQLLEELWYLFYKKCFILSLISIIMLANVLYEFLY